MTSSAVPTDAADANPRPGLVASLMETTKPGITRLVTITAGVGFAMGHLTAASTRPARETAALGLACLIGTYLTAGGANSHP